MEGIPSDIIHRYEKIPTSIYEDEAAAVKYVCDLVVDAINLHNNNYPNRNFLLGLTTGRTPLGVYHELVHRYEQGEVSFRNVEVYRTAVLILQKQL